MLLLALILLALGGVLVWSGFTGRDPREELRAAFGGR